MITTILMVLAFVLLLVAAFNVPFPYANLGWLGLAFWALAIILTGVPLR